MDNLQFHTSDHPHPTSPQSPIVIYLGVFDLWVSFPIA